MTNSTPKKEIVFHSETLSAEWYESMRKSFEERNILGKPFPNVIILFPWSSLNENLVRFAYDRQVKNGDNLDYARLPFYDPERINLEL
jgi:hypothetical protein